MTEVESCDGHHHNNNNHHHSCPERSELMFAMEMWRHNPPQWRHNPLLCDVILRRAVMSKSGPLWRHIRPLWRLTSPSVTSHFALLWRYTSSTVYHVAESVDAILKSRWTDRNYKKKGLRSLKEKIYSMAPPCRLCLPLYSWHNDFVLGFNLA